MGAGGPGDHPLTDILYYETSEFGPEVHTLVKKIAEHRNFSTVRTEVSRILMECSPYGSREEPSVLNRQALERLCVIESKLSASA